MIAKVLRGQRATGLLAYLFGPGDRNEHRNPRVIAGWDQLHRITPEVGADGRPDHRRLGALLDATWRAAGMRSEDRPVYHVSVAVARADPVRGLPADPDLTDARFGELCAALMRAVGLAEGCRWVAVRHDQPGESHAHIVATLASEDGRRFHPPKGDFYRLGQVCRDYETRYGLRSTAPREPAAAKRPTSQETRKAERKRWREPTRALLRQQVRAVAGTAESVEDFLRRLRDDGLLVSERHSPRDGTITGYAVAVQRPARDGTVEQVWFGGGKLAADLTLPKLRRRWPQPAPPSASEQPATPLVDRDQVWRQAVAAAREATTRVRAHAADPAGAAQAAWQASDFLASLAQLVPGRDGRAVREAAAGFERAGYTAWAPPEPPPAAGGGLRAAARLLTAARYLPRDDTGRLLALLAQLAALGDAIDRMRQAQHRAHQAECAHRAAHTLRVTAPVLRPDHDPPAMPPLRPHPPGLTAPGMTR